MTKNTRGSGVGLGTLWVGWGFLRSHITRGGDTHTLVSTTFSTRVCIVRSLESVLDSYYNKQTQTKHILHFGPRALELTQVSEELKGRIQEVRRI